MPLYRDVGSKLWGRLVYEWFLPLVECVWRPALFARAWCCGRAVLAFGPFSPGGPLVAQLDTDIVDGIVLGADEC